LSPSRRCCCGRRPRRGRRAIRLPAPSWRCAGAPPVTWSGRRRAVQGPPAFQTIARARAPDSLRAFLARPHPPMPPIDLSRADIDNLVAYIETQR
jgi:hypothetical protein